ncbi:transmembrane protease serine 11B-like [Pollicipes pollicipes]|uniref:transmembrane protease serine 11B-like n=1 Tax=Pollicipes pollicipes TaxID=41117 RepID=UPI0018857456|nr:transmembrane protease serine 11B-like [Pollicipes pollicipes]
MDARLAPLGLAVLAAIVVSSRAATAEGNKSARASAPAGPLAGGMQRGPTGEGTHQEGAREARRNWVTPSVVSSQSPQEVGSSTELPSSGKFLIHTGVEATFASPGFPDDYPPDVWTSWIFQAKDAAATLHVTCPEFALGGQDSLSLRTPEHGRQLFFRDNLTPPAVSSRGRVVAQLRTGRRDHGRFRCTVRAELIREVSESDLPAVQVNDPLCGRTKHTTRIVGGEAAPKNTYPWLVGVTTRSRADMFCEGSIINERFVLTAAHCVARRKLWVLNVQVRKHLRNRDSEELRFKVKRVIKYPGYKRLQDDIALLELDGSLRLLLHNDDVRVRPICLPTTACGGGSGDACFGGRTAVVAGWGVNQQRPKAYPKSLQRVELPVLTSEACEASQPTVITDSMLCTSYSGGGRDACQGDSGGPLMVDTGKSKTTLIGIVSFGKGCGVPEHPAVYTRVSEYYDWIIENARL